MGFTGNIIKAKTTIYSVDFKNKKLLGIEYFDNITYDSKITRIEVAGKPYDHYKGKLNPKKPLPKKQK